MAKKSKLKKTLKITTWIILIILLLVVPVASFLAKYLIQKYDVEYTGREITLDWSYVNPFTGYVHLDDLVIFEEKSDQPFISMDGLSANMAMLKLFSKTYEIEYIELAKPYVNVIEKKENFNFTDLIKTFTRDSTKTKPEKEVRFSMLNIDIVDGDFHYDERPTPVNYSVEKVNIYSEGYRYNVDTMHYQYSFSSGVGSGELAGDFNMNFDNKDFRLDVKIDSFDLYVVNQYIKDLTNYGVLAATLDADIKSSGNFNSVDSTTTAGNVTVSDFHFGKNKREDFASFEKLAVDIIELSPKKFIYHFDSILLKKPFIRYEKYDTLDNFQTMFGKGGKNVADANANPYKFNLVIATSEFIQKLSKNLLNSHYKVDRLAISEGDLQFSDFSQGEKFHIASHPFYLMADSLDQKRERVKVKVKSSIQPHGEFWVALSMNPQDSSYFDLDYRFHTIPLSMFNPYMKQYTSFPLDRGSLEFTGNWHVRAGDINSSNHLIIIDPRTSKRVRNKDTQWIPVPLAMAVLKERGNVIDYEVPITGNIHDPNFNFWDVILDLIKNIFIKPATIPYAMEVNSVERKLEKSLSMQWGMQEHKLTSTQEKFIEKMIEFLEDNPDAHITVAPQNYLVKEQELILLFEAKKRYFLDKHDMKSDAFSEKDSIQVQKMSIKDEAFVKYLNTHVASDKLFTVQHKASHLIKQSWVNQRYGELLDARQATFLSLFKEEKLDDRVKFLANKNLVPYNWFSFYEITYEGDFPDYLREAHKDMDELDDLSPREQYQDKREKISNEK
ncbi:MAG: DUF748 domain-containing protein [Brumimicrobium sp.]